MRIVNIGTFLLPVRFSLSALMKPGGREELAEMLSTGLTEFQPRARADGGGLVFDIRDSMHQRMETMVFTGVMEIEGAGRVRLYVSSLAVGFVVTELELPDDMSLDLDIPEDCDRFKSYEEPVTQAVEPFVARWSERIVEVIDPAILRPLPPSAMQSGTLLWWHRVCVDAQPALDFPAARWYGVTAELAQGAVAQVTVGVSNLHTMGRRDLVHDTVEGLLVATQEWIVVDEAKRHIADHLVALSQGEENSLVSVDSQYVDVLALTEDVTMRNLLLGQEARYLTVSRLRVRQAASQAWGTTTEAETLDERTAALRDLFSLHRERIFNDRDDRRNRLVFVFTAITLIQSILVWYDFITSDSTATGSSPRPEIGIVVLVLTLVSVVGAILTRPKARKRGRLRRPTIPRQRQAPVSAPERTPRDAG
ncbi:MAG: hypothetical protein HOV77_14665 [Hamadaea sp.]|uniref:hypothetical protein n=1 Tax=Hamadaea sp. TaxID=2024425 RepID=UPI0018032C7F|nr:hypothetical protein [Hamadaea sp.]NUT20426.1 hypothetical protein [Hamadaea sp.]